MSKMRTIPKPLKNVGKTSVPPTTVTSVKQKIIDTVSLNSAEEVEMFLREVKILSKYIANLASIVFPLYTLHRDKGEWKWNKDHEECLKKLKDEVQNMRPLHPHVSYLPLYLKSEATSCGLRATLFHQQDGVQKIIGHASRLFNDKEANYSSIEQHSCAIIFAVKKFRSYVTKRKFTLCTNERAWKYIFETHPDLTAKDAVRLEKWANLLTLLDYSIEYTATTVSSSTNEQRLPLKSSDKHQEVQTNLFYSFKHQISALPVSSEQLRFATARDEVLENVLRYLLAGKWPKDIGEDLQPYFHKKDEMSVEGGIILWGLRVVIPKTLQGVILSYLHQGHPGVMKMKALSLLHAWFPHINRRIEKLVNSCVNCAENTTTGFKSSCDFPKEPMDRVRLDVFGPFSERNCLIMTDTFSGWVEVKSIDNFDVQNILRILRNWFSQFGIPKQVVVPTSSSTEFMCHEFTEFITEQGICRIASPSYHNESNTEAERCVRAIKKSLQSNSNEDVVQNLDSFLLTYRATPSTWNGKSPSELFLRRKITTKSDLVIDKWDQRKVVSVREQRESEYVFGDAVLVQCDGKHVAGTVMEKVDETNYEVYVDGCMMRKNVSQISADKVNEKRLNTI